MRFVVLFCITLLLSCTPKTSLEPVFSPQAEQLSRSNRLDKALAALQDDKNAAEKDWSFSALFAIGDTRLPLLVIVRGTPQAANTSKDALDAMLLTETSLGLCRVHIDRSSVTTQTTLPGVQIQSLCERVGTALQRLLLEPQPSAYDQTVSPTELRRSIGNIDYIFRFTVDGAMRSKQELWGESSRWQSEYTNSILIGDVYIPSTLRYTENGWNLRLVRLPAAP